MVSVAGAATTVNVMDEVAESVGWWESDAFMTRLVLPATDGVPVIVQLLMLKPEGRVPLTIEQA